MYAHTCVCVCARANVFLHRYTRMARYLYVYTHFCTHTDSYEYALTLFTCHAMTLLRAEVSPFPPIQNPMSVLDVALILSLSSIDRGRHDVFRVSSRISRSLSGVYESDTFISAHTAPTRGHSAESPQCRLVGSTAAVESREFSTCALGQAQKINA